MHFLDVLNESQDSENSEDLVGKKPELNFQKNLQISRIWQETEPKLSSTWQLKKVKD
jgi:hypothetical protein